MNYPQSGSLLSERINSGLSTQIVIKVNNVPVGAIQRLAINQNRDLHRWEEIGTDGIVEIHPKGATKITITVDRVVFDGLRLTESFARGFINIQSQRIPFDVEIIDKSELMDGRNAIVHTFHNCWFNQYNPQFRADSFIVSETAQLWCEYVTTTRDSLSAVYGGIRKINYEYDTIERSTDINGKRGRYEKSNVGDPLTSF